MICRVYETMVPLLDLLISPFGVPPSLEDSSPQGLKGRWRHRWKPGCAALRRVVTSVVCQIGLGV